MSSGSMSSVSMSGGSMSLGNIMKDKGQGKRHKQELV